MCICNHFQIIFTLLVYPDVLNTDCTVDCYVGCYFQLGITFYCSKLQVLQSVFMKSNSPALCCTILDAISSVYHADNANYFILENQNTLSQFSERIYTKNAEIQEKFFELLEFIVFQLNFVPCKELISLSLLLKANRSRTCSILCMKTLLNILK